MTAPTPSRDIGKLPMPIDDHKEDRQFVTALRVGKGMPMMVLSASGDIRSMTPQFVEQTVRPLLLRSAWAIEQHFQQGN